MDAERAVKRLAEPGEEGQGTPEVKDIALNLASLRQPCNRLVDDGEENARRDIFAARPLVEQRLYVRFCKHAAARRDGIGALAPPGERVHLVRRDAHERRHLVDKRPRTPGATAVHTDFHGTIKEEDLGVLPAEFNDDGRLGREAADGDARRPHLLHEREPEVVRNPHAGRAGDAEEELLLREPPGDLMEQIGHALGDLRAVAVVTRIEYLARVRQHHALDRGGTDINPQSFHRLFPPIPRA